MTVDRVEIVLASLEDVPDIVELNRQFHKNMKDFRWDSSDWIQTEVEHGNYYVAKKENQIVGAINVQEIPNLDMYIETIATDPDQHGSGIGRMLINFVKEKALSKGFKKLTVESFESYGIKDFYLKVGFQLDSPSVDYVDSQPYFRFVMHL